MNNPDERVIWANVLRIMKKTDDSIGYRIYLEPVVPVEADNAHFTISVPMTITKTMIERRYKDQIEAAVTQITGRVLELKIILSDEAQAIFDKRGEEKRKREEEYLLLKSNYLNPAYTFDNFVIGSSNQYAASAAIAATENPGYIYNPLFLYGKSGLGKTHLMLAMGNKIRKEHPEYNIIYTTAEAFMNEFIDSLNENKRKEFKKKYREVDVLLIDDVQFLENKESTQEEFFHTFNALYTLNKQIVITSDRKPGNLLTLEERLRTRFSQGLTTDLSVPDFETRVAILQRKAAERGKTLPEPVIKHIAERIKSNVRELEGALNKIISMSQIATESMTVEFAENVIKSILPEDGIVKITPDKIMDKVALFYSITKDDLIGNVRIKEYAFPRQIAMYLCFKLTDMKYPMIGKVFGGKDRSTVKHNIEKITAQMKTDAKLHADINYIVKDLETV